jgi:hypothetical protein
MRDRAEFPPSFPGRSLVLADEAGRWRPAPAHDLPSSSPYGDTTLTLPERAARRALTETAGATPRCEIY